MTKKTKAILLTSLALLLLGGGGAGFYYLQQKEKAPAAPVSLEDANGLPALARKQIGVTVGYSPDYVVLDYPGGDVPMETGVCTDVVVRALRLKGIDLQQLVHEDMAKNFAEYPQKWQLKRPDSNIDHRRVPNLETWFTRHDKTRPISKNPSDYQAGDIVSWRLDNGLAHIGVVSDGFARDGTPLVIHNIGAGAQEEDVLFSWRMVGHYRYFVK